MQVLRINYAFNVLTAITYECYSDGDCVYGYCEVGRCRCASDADCTNVGENCFHGGCIGDDPVSTMGPSKFTILSKV